MDQAPSGFLTFAEKNISFEDLANAVSDVLVTNSETVQLMCQTKGGWEGWLQGVLSIHLARNGYDVQREVLVYGDRRAADLLIGDACVIELKALGLARDTGSFFDGVDVDIAKLRELGSGNRFAVVVVPGFSLDVYRTALSRLKGFTEMRRQCSEQFNLFILKNP